MSDELKAAESAVANSYVPFRIEVKDGRADLTVFAPPEGTEPPTVEEIRKAANTQEVYKIDEAAVRAAILSASGEPVKIGTVAAEDAEVRVHVAKDGMKAWMNVSAPSEEGKGVVEDDIRLALRAGGITFGIKDDSIEGFLASPVYENEVLVAEGRPVTDGIDGEIIFHFETEKVHKPRVVDEDGKVDHKELGLLENVVEGQLLAEKKPPTSGTAGVTVKNEYIASKPGKEARLLAGKNVKLSPDESEARATANGLAMLHAGKVVVSQVYTVKGSVGAETGNINFLGTVQIADSVEDGYTVKATEDIIVGKTVGKATLEAGRNVIIRGGIMGHNEGRIVAGNDVRSRYIQEAKVDARRDIIATEAILHSEVEAGSRIIVGLGGRKGMVTGGQIRALKLLACRTLGSKMSTKTVVDVGINPKYLARSEELQETIIQDRKNFENIQKGMTSMAGLKEKLGALPPDKEKILNTLVLARDSLKAKLQESAQALRDVQSKIAMDVKGKISVEETLYSGVKLAIGSVSYYVTTEERHVTLTEAGGEIRMHAYEAPVVADEEPVEE